MSLLDIALGSLALVSLGITLWQWLEGVRYPLNRRFAVAQPAPPVTLLKPLKGCDSETSACLRSWLNQDYSGQCQILFGVASHTDPVVEAVQAILAENPGVDAQLVFCGKSLGPNAKVSTLSQLEKRAKYDLLVVSDADVRVPQDSLAQLLSPFQDESVGLVCPFYRLANPTTVAMRWEALAVNSDFWLGVLQSMRFAPLSYALGAAMAVRRSHLEAIGGFAALTSHLADDFELGRRVARLGARLELCPTVVDCWEPKQGWTAVWRHQLRWARTIRVCMPAPYAASLISNSTLWPVLWCLACPRSGVAGFLALCLLVRVVTAADNQRRLTGSLAHWAWCWMAPVKDLLQLALWFLSFLGNTIEWRGNRFKVLAGGRLRPA